MTSGRESALVTGVASGKGGVGKTLLASCLGTILNEVTACRGKVLLADLDFGVKGLTFLYGPAGSWKDCSGSMADIIANRKKPEAVIEGANRFNELVVVPADANFNEKIDWDFHFPDYKRTVTSIGAFIETAKKKGFEYIIFDTGAGLDESTVALSNHADMMLLVVEPDEISLTAAIDLRAELSGKRSDVSFVVNKEPDDYPVKVQEVVGPDVTFRPSLPFDRRMHSQFVKDARRLALGGYIGTRYKRFVGSLANDIFEISAKTPTAVDRIWRMTAAKVAFRFLGYGSIFLMVVIAILVGLIWSLE